MNAFSAPMVVGTVGWPRSRAANTAANARFALSLDDRPQMAAHATAVFAARERGQPTVPTTIGVEKAFNPFLRAGDAAGFAARRAAKDSFAG